MQKLFKKIAVLLIALVAVLGITAFATACDDNSVTYATAGTEITIIVKDENGNRIDGPNFGKTDDGEEDFKVGVNLCTVVPDAEGGLGNCSQIAWLDATGEVKIKYDDIVRTLETTKTAYPNNNVTGEMELHVNYVKGKGYEHTYGKYPIDKIPSTITITLVKLADNG